MPRTNVRTVAWLAVLLVLALAPAFAGSPTRDVAPAAPPPNHQLLPIYFAAGTTQIRPTQTRILDAHAVWLRRDRKQVLLIEGHTDGSGDNAFSREVGEQRAKSAKAYLVSKGVLAEHIVTFSRGGGSPACKEKTATCRATNRRATFSMGVLP